MRSRLLATVLLLTGCASGPPTVRFDAAGFVVAYMARRDADFARIVLAKERCARLRLMAAETTREKCTALDRDVATWRDLDSAVLQALVTRQTVDAETLRRIGVVVLEVARLAADVLL